MLGRGRGSVQEGQGWPVTGGDFERGPGEEQDRQETQWPGRGRAGEGQRALPALETTVRAWDKPEGCEQRREVTGPAICLALAVCPEAAEGTEDWVQGRGVAYGRNAQKLEPRGSRASGSGCEQQGIPERFGG